MNKKERFLTGSYLCLEMVLFLLIKWAEAEQPFFIYGKIEYLAIVLNFIVALYFYLGYQKERIILLGLAVTLIADYFLTLMGTHFSWGVFCFFTVQLIYGFKIGYERWNVALRMLLFACFLLLIHLLGMPWDFAIPCSLSICALLGNVVAGFYFSIRKKDRIRFLFAMGLLLFAGCDLSLGLGLVTKGIAPFATFHDWANEMVWIFYVPSQVLITLTGIFENTCGNSMN